MFGKGPQTKHLAEFCTTRDLSIIPLLADVRAHVAWLPQNLEPIQSLRSPSASDPAAPARRDVVTAGERSTRETRLPTRSLNEETAEVTIRFTSFPLIGAEIDGRPRREKQSFAIQLCKAGRFHCFTIPDQLHGGEKQDMIHNMTVFGTRTQATGGSALLTRRSARSWKEEITRIHC